MRLHYLVRGFRNRKYTHTEGYINTEHPNRDTAIRISKAVRGEGINPRICILTDVENGKKYIYELLYKVE